MSKIAAIYSNMAMGNIVVEIVDGKMEKITGTTIYQDWEQADEKARELATMSNLEYINMR